MDYWLEVALVFCLCFLLGGLARLKNVLTTGGSLLAVVVGLVIGLAGGLSWVLLLLIFLVTSFAATKYKFALKKEMGLQEGVRGERDWENVLASGLVPLVIAVMSLENDLYPTLDRTTGSSLFLCAVAIAAADTVASELGILSRKTWLITTGKRVRAGTDGGISVLGQVWAFMAALYTGAVGMVVLGYFDQTLDFFWWLPIFIAVIGFIGCQIDSVIGATIEQRGYVSKLTNNLMSITLGTILAWVIMWLVC
jgi:uncharacterized protein (TIGR00297 family)